MRFSIHIKFLTSNHEKEEFDYILTTRFLSLLTHIHHKKTTIKKLPNENPRDHPTKRVRPSESFSARSHSHGIGHLHFRRGSFTSYFNSRLKCLLIQKEGLYLIGSYVGSCFLSQSCGHEVSIPYFSATIFLGLVLVSRGVSSINTFEFSFRRFDQTVVACFFTSSLSAHPNECLCFGFA